MSEHTISAFDRFLRKNAFLLIMLLAGIALLLIPGSTKKEPADEKNVSTEAEKRLCQTLSQIEGVGEVRVLLAEKPGRDAGFAGAVIVCAGADEPQVRLHIVESVRAFTQLGTNHIVVQKMIS